MTQIYQQSLDFTHQRENNSTSQKILDANRARITKRVKQVLELLSRGIHLTVKSALVDYDVSSLPRRILDIEENCGIKAKRKHDTFTTYYFDAEQIVKAKEILNKIK